MFELVRIVTNGYTHPKWFICGEPYFHNTSFMRYKYASSVHTRLISNIQIKSLESKYKQYNYTLYEAFIVNMITNSAEFFKLLTAPLLLTMGHH